MIPSTATTTVVWSRSLRLLHWTLALSMVTSFVTHEGGGWVHEWTGYAALATAALRVLLGLFGAGRWRFAGFVCSPAATWAYTRSVLKHREARFVGHNPLGGWMVLVLLANALATGLTGWLYTTDRFWGLAWLETLHGALGESLLPLLLLHVAGVVFTSRRQGDNLVAAMLHGRKRTRASSPLR